MDERGVPVLKTRILYVHPCAGLGGAPLSLLYLIQQLDRDRFAPEVLLTGRAGEEAPLFLQQGIPVHFRPDITTYPHARNAHLSLRSLRPWELLTRAVQILPSARRMHRFLKEHAFDLVHLNTSVLLPAGIGASRADVRVVWHIREPLHPGMLGLRRRVVATIIRRCADAIVAISESDAEPWAGDPKLKIVYNVVDFGRFNRAIDGDEFRLRCGLPQERPIIAMLGGTIHSKGTDVLIEAAAHVKEKRPDALFVVAGAAPGGGESPSPLRRVVRRALERSGVVPSMDRRVLKLMEVRRLHDTVRFVGLRQDIPEMLAAATLLVWPATVPHFARPIIEAGAMALPVVASGYAVTREVVVPGKTGLLVRPGDPRSLAEAIIHLLDHPEEARRLGEAAFAIARDRHDAAHNARQVMAVYDGLMSSARAETDT